MKALGSVEDLGTILGIWAHPDDEIFSMAGIMATAIANDQQVVCVTATRGEAGVQDELLWPKSHLAEIRTQELDSAYQILGVNYHYWLDYADGECEKVKDIEAANKLAMIIKKYQPDSILTFDSTGMTGHPDHIAVSRWAALARELASSRAELLHTALTFEQYEVYRQAGVEKDFFYNIDKPELHNCDECKYCLRLDKRTIGLKLEALRAMPSQTAHLMGLLESSLKPALSVEAFRAVLGSN